MEVASYARFIAARVAKLIISHIICRYRVPHELISDRGVHFRGEVDTLIQEYDISITDCLRTSQGLMGQLRPRIRI